ncbi:MAG TPA: hypothetical protein PKY59_19810 [Pyrinomonadaceae bacterium]|nr:hypothetical protein [Pyrinomonadaceae bacterium]
MSRFTVNLEDSPSKSANVKSENVPSFGEVNPPKKRGRFGKILGIFAAVIGAVLLIGAVGGYFYWQSLKKTPQYSLALIIDAARNNDQKTIDSLVDTNAVVDDFMPQITEKAVELYGKGLPAQTISKVAQVAAPLLPAIKDRAKAELPRVIREKTDKFSSVPFFAIVIGADRYLEINQTADIAIIKSKIKERPLEVKMKKNGDKWQIIAVKDEQLATRIAQKVGQEIIAAATKGSIRKAGETLGIKNLQDLLNQAEDILK